MGDTLRRELRFFLTANGQGRRVDLLGGTVGSRVAVLLAQLFKVLRPGQTGGRGGGGGTTETDTALTDGQKVVHPVRHRVASSHVALARLVGFLYHQLLLCDMKRLLPIKSMKAEHTLKNKAFLTSEGQEACNECQSPTWCGPQSMGTNSCPMESAFPTLCGDQV